MKIAIGMDLHKASAVCFASYAGEGEPNERQMDFLNDFNVKYRTQPSTPEYLAKIADALKGHDAYILIENSTKTFEAYWVLTYKGCNVVVAQAQDLYRITKSVKKTDMNDSFELSAYMRRRLRGEIEFAVCTMPPKEWMMRREICRTLFKQKRHLGDLKRRARAHLLLHGIQLSKEYSDIFSAKATEELRKTKDPVLLLLTKEAWEIKSGNDRVMQILRYYFEGDKNVELISSIPGFGEVTAAYLSSMIMDIDRFRSRDAFTAYFGVVPRVSESGGKSHRCSTTHRGDEEVRRLVMQAAFVHCNTVDDSVVKRLWDRLKAKGVAHREIQCACARKLLTVVWSVLKNRRRYVDDPDLRKVSDEMSEEMMEESGDE